MSLAPAGGGGFPSSPGTGVNRPSSLTANTPQPSAAPTPPEHSLGQFVATAYGPPWVGIQGTGTTADGTNLHSNPHIFGVAVDPSVIPLGTFLLIWPNPFEHKGTFKAFDTGGAIKGKRIDFYDWRGRASQTKWGRKTVQVSRVTHPGETLTPPKGDSGFLGINIPNPLSAADAAANAIKDLIEFVLSPSQIGDLLAKIAAYFVKLIAKAIWQYVIAPLIHWAQRATAYYYDHTLTESTGIPGFVTFSFWATGYAILWAKADGSSAVAAPGETPLGRFVRANRNTVARRKLIKPGDVKEKTKQKPEPVKSRAEIQQTRELSVARPRTVKVEGGENGSGIGESADFVEGASEGIVADAAAVAPFAA